MKFSSQKGFSLLEVSIATAIAALGIVATLQMRATQAQIDTARSVAQVYERLNSAAGNYMTIYYKDIIKKAGVSSVCGESAFQIPLDGFFTTVNHGPDCKIELTVNGQKQTVNNFLQPKLKELEKLGLLTASDAEYETKLPLPSFSLAGGSASTSMVAYNTSTDPSFGVFANPARNGMAILISLKCIDNSSSSNACTVFEMRSLVHNIQPYSDINDNATLLYRVVGAAGGGRTYLSDTRFNGKLRADGGVSDLPNPIKMRNTSDGPPYILAMRNGYSVDDKNQFLRKDGSTPLTADWNVGGQSITGINDLAASSARVTGDLNAGSVSAGTVYGNSVSGITGVFGNFFGGVRAALNATTAYFSGNVTVDANLNVANDTQVSGALSVTGGTKVADFKLKNEAKLGDACNPQDQTLVRASESSAGFNDTALRMLVCDPVTSRWTRAQADYAPQIAEINTAILNLGGQIGNINTNISGINTNIGGIKDIVTDYGKRLAKVEGEYMTWDFINVTWSRADSGVPSSNVWKKTPFQCRNIGGNADGSGAGLPVYGGEVGVRWKQYASDIQKGLAGASYTPPIFIGFDNTPEEEVVYDINCENGSWYVGISTKASNIKGGNVCRDGLLRPLYPSLPCDSQPFNLSTPSYNKQVMSARFITFTRKP